MCDVEQELLEPSVADQIGPSCASCGAPTERIALLREGVAVKSPHAMALGHLGGIKGGRARAASLTPQRRSDIARAAAAARWKREKS